MVTEVWLHIGTPKSGTSSLQNHLATHRDALAKQGLIYLAPKGLRSANELAIAWNNDRHDQLAALTEPMNRDIEQRDEPRALISSEMFYGLPPQAIFQMFPALRTRALKVLVYLRRQDRYIEALYVQKSKNARFLGSIADYIAKFNGSGSDYADMLLPWQDQDGDVELIPRVLERARLSGGDVVADAFAQIGLPAPPVSEETDLNVSPGLHRVQLLQAAARAGIVSPRRLQRQLAAQFPQDIAERAPIFADSERRAYLDRYAAANEALRARYFPDWDTLFDMGDLKRSGASTGIAPFSEAQLAEISMMLQVLGQLVKEQAS